MVVVAMEPKTLITYVNCSGVALAAFVVVVDSPDDFATHQCPLKSSSLR